MFKVIRKLIFSKQKRKPGVQSCRKPNSPSRNKCLPQTSVVFRATTVPNEANAFLEAISGEKVVSNPNNRITDPVNSNSPVFSRNATHITVDSDLHRRIVEEVAEFHQNFSNLQTDVRILVSKNVIVYVLGTNHANTQCTDEVINIIEKLQPKTVLVELCSLRACNCSKHKGNAFQTTPKFTFRYLRSIISKLSFLPAMIFFTDVFREHIVSEGSLLHYGGEFIAAIATAQNIDSCRIVLADRPIEVTIKRQASAMGNWRGLMVTLQVTLALFFKKRMKRLMLSANKAVFGDPRTYEVLVFERDLYLTHSIQQEAKVYENEGCVSRVIAVIGQGHVRGVQTYWGKVPSEFIPFIMSPQTVLDK